MFVRIIGYLFLVVCAATLLLNLIMVQFGKKDEWAQETFDLDLNYYKVFDALNYTRTTEPTGGLFRHEAAENYTGVMFCSPEEQLPSVPKPSVSVYRGKSRLYTTHKAFAAASTVFRCNESITYTTHGEFQYLDNLAPLAQRWQGPISVAIYAPGTDFYEAAVRIKYLRECATPLIKLLVTFHLFFDQKLGSDTETSDLELIPVNCTERPDFGDQVSTYRQRRHLTYPINVARNLARNEARTHFVLASDIELYPSTDVIPRFLEMVLNYRPLYTIREHVFVYVLPIFEIEQDRRIPDTKGDLQGLIRMNQAVPFHKYICSYCHLVPKMERWLSLPASDKMGVFFTWKRKGSFALWEPIFIGTKTDPLYDDRLNWEGLKDKMTQAYTMCVLDYNFKILDSAYLIHRPGVKRQRKTEPQLTHTRRQDNLIENVIRQEITEKYGTRRGCIL